MHYPWNKLLILLWYVCFGVQIWFLVIQKQATGHLKATCIRPIKYVPWFESPKFPSWGRKAHWLLLWKVEIWDHFQRNSWRRKRTYAQILKSGDVWSISFLTDHCNDHKSPFSIDVALDGTKCTLTSIGYLTKQTNRNWSDCWDLKQLLAEKQNLGNNTM